MATSATLLAKVAQVEALLARCNQTLSSSTPAKSSTTPSTDAPNPLLVLRDTAKLLRAHATKIGLLLINEPFTPSAVQKELAACEKLCVPSMVGAVGVVHPQMWTESLAKEARLRVQAATGAFGILLADVRSKCQGGTVRVESVQHKEKTLVSTGQVWEACDALVELERRGLVDVVLKKAKEREDMIKDALEELKEWREDEEEQDEGFVAGSDDDDDDDDRNSAEDLFAGGRLPAHREDIKELFDAAFKQLKLVNMLFQAIIKRRAKTFTVPEYEDASRRSERIARVTRANDLLERMQAIGEGVDELAGAFYELNTEQAKTQLHSLVVSAHALADSMQRSWEDGEDEFTGWSKKWKETMRKQERE
ncbi:uncharacterized protein PV09_00984 [Verruconis gallopava]|uniref:Cyclin-D1-binding protein 1-like N-terminal domain-containing protein n=1 Tax=Verruconis gallopava TaxID=253628 RepID=A0A0D2ANI2_9PEZI|nr:uncharacterized protein PV09_00984 [Verruconis gallopava]KIW08040.1 hypothetical protein PV09_00984 [Verruconis gallopava]